MLFNSYEFLIFFPLVTACYFLLPDRFRWLLLLIASCVFYMAFVPVYILILGFTIVVDYFAGILIESAEGARRKAFLICSIFANVGVLAFFKYYNFFVGNVEYVCHQLGMTSLVPTLNIVLPIGLSFHTFQAMAYTIEVYRGAQKPERNFGIYALYVMFYPQLVAGPIERPQNLIHQFHDKHKFDYDNVASGLRTMLWGFFKKVVIADRMAVLVNGAYAQPAAHSSVTLLLATYCFAVQIYCDFSGYSDIAIGAARVMGFSLMTNFRRPYFSTSIQEFWRRWHISLSTWFKDYLYIPLGGSRVGQMRNYSNLLIVFLVSGLWHGANWTYVVWGALHGIYMIISQAFKESPISKVQFPFTKSLSMLLTFNLVCIAWVFFRAESVDGAFLILQRIFGGLAQDAHALVTSGLTTFLVDLNSCGLSTSDLFIGACLITIWLIAEVLEERYHVAAALRTWPFAARWSIYYATAFCVLFLGAQAVPFIYFQF